ncbi:MAG: VWA domain-containing protein [Polyangiaceae bacterium]|nr:VWA domain-containing protein [Polyangiaceae bacterium]
MRWLRCVWAPISLLTLLGCGALEGDVGGEVGGEGGQYPSLSGGAGGLEASSEPAEGLSVTALDVSPKSPNFVCQGTGSLGADVVTGAPHGMGGLSSVQVAKAALALGQWPDPAHVRLEDFATYYGDQAGVGALETLALRATLTEGGLTEEGKRVASLSVAARLPRDPSSRPALHLIAVTDVSESTGASVNPRDGVLDALAAAIEASGKDQLSIVAYGDPPELIVERVAASDASAAVDAAKDALAPRPGSDLVGALALVPTLAGSDPSHVVVLTDGGTLFDSTLDEVVAENARLGIVTSIVQIGRDTPPDTPLFVNYGLLDGVSRRGLGTRMFLSGSAVDGADPLRTFTDRYEELFPIAGAPVFIDVALPLGLKGDVPDPIEASPSVIGHRSAGVDLKLELGCEGALSEVNSSTITASLRRAGERQPFASASVSTVDALAEGGASNLTAVFDALPAVVRALRTRSAADLEAALTAVKDGVGGEACSDLVDPATCDLADLCCARADLLELLGQACGLAEGCE